MYKFIHSPYPRVRDAINDLKRKIEEIDFKPNLAIFFLTESLINNFSEFSKLVNCNSICMPIEGYMTPDAVWTRGCLVFLTDIDHQLHILKGMPDDVVSSIREMKKGKFNLLIYPLVFTKSRLQVYKAGLQLRRLYKEYITNPEEALYKASKIYEREFIYPANKILRPFRDAESTALSLNIFPLKTNYGHPVIAINGKKINKAVVWISFNNKLKLDFTDIFPERGSDYEETKEILKKEFMIGKEVKVDMKGITIGHIDGMRISDFLRSRKVFLLKKEIEKYIEDFFSSSPYGLCFISRATHGAITLGLTDFPLDLYPSIFELDNFYQDALFIAETIRGGINTVIKFIEDKKSNFSAIDQNFILMYENQVKRLVNTQIEFGIFTSCPNLTTTSIKKRLMSEIEKNIYLNAARNIAFVNWL